MNNAVEARWVAVLSLSVAEDVVSYENEEDNPMSGVSKKTAYMSFVAPSSGCVDVDFDYKYGFDFTKNLFMSIHEAQDCDTFPFEELQVTLGGFNPHIKVVDGNLNDGQRYWVMLGIHNEGEEVTGTLHVTDPCVETARSLSLEHHM